MRIRLVAIRALGKCQRLLEIPIGVALLTSNREVLPLQRIFRFRVVEFLADRLQRNLLPSRRAMA